MFTHKSDSDPLMDLYHSSSLDQLDNKFKSLCENYFIEKFALASVSKTRNISQYNQFECFHTYPLEWANYYNNKKYYLQDPVFLRAENNTTPYYWHFDKFDNTTEDQKKILREGSDFNIKRGTTIPLMQGLRIVNI